jgi:hypothetical protein
MGTWGPGPFDNDTAAGFAGDLDDTPPREREALVPAGWKSSTGPGTVITEK